MLEDFLISWVGSLLDNSKYQSSKLISLIVPVYNCERYIYSALSSLAREFGEETEIIVVNDGSTDRSLREIYRFIETHKDINIFLYSILKNQGVSTSRNTGISHARSKYIGFLDADDIYLSGVGNSVLEAVKQDVDIIEFGFKRFQSERGLYSTIGIKLPPFKGKHTIREIESAIFSRTVWYPSIRLYKKSLWENIRFPPKEVYEDVRVIPLIFKEAKTIFYIDKAFLGYRYNSSSITSKRKEPEVFSLIQFYHSIADDLRYPNIFRVRLARTVANFSMELKISIRHYRSVVIDARARKVECSPITLLLPDLLFYRFGIVYDFLNFIRFKIR